MKAKMMYFLIAIVLIVSTSACLCSGPGAAPKIASTAIPITPTPVVTFGVGDAINLGGNIITVTKAEYDDGGEWDKPDRDKTFLLVYLHIENAGDKEMSVNPYDFKVKDGNGVIVDHSWISVEDSLGALDLAPSGKVDGVVPFEIPRNTDLQLIYQPNFWVDRERIVVKLGKSPE